MDYQVADYGGCNEAGKCEDVGDVIDVLMAGFEFFRQICEGWRYDGGFGWLITGVSDVRNL